MFLFSSFWHLLLLVVVRFNTCYNDGSSHVVAQSGEELEDMFLVCRQSTIKTLAPRRLPRLALCSFVRSWMLVLATVLG